METTLTLRNRLGFNEVALWKQFCARRLHLIHTLSLNLRKASEQEEQVRVLAAELCAEYGFGPHAQCDFEKLLIAGIQSVRRNQKRSARHPHGYSDTDIVRNQLAEDGAIINGNKLSPRIVTPLTPMGMHSHSHGSQYFDANGINDANAQANGGQPVATWTSDTHPHTDRLTERTTPGGPLATPMFQSLVVRLDVLRDMIGAGAATWIESSANVMAQMSAYGVLSTAVAAASVHGKLTAEESTAMRDSILDGPLLESLRRALNPGLTRVRLLERIGALAASLVHGPHLLSALQALCVSLAQASHGIESDMRFMLKPLARAEPDVEPHENSDDEGSSPNTSEAADDPDYNASQAGGVKNRRKSQLPAPTKPVQRRQSQSQPQPQPAQATAQTTAPPQSQPAQSQPQQSQPAQSQPPQSLPAQSQPAQPQPVQSQPAQPQSQPPQPQSQPQPPQQVLPPQPHQAAFPPQVMPPHLIQQPMMHQQVMYAPMPPHEAQNVHAMQHAMQQPMPPHMQFMLQNASQVPIPLMGPHSMPMGPAYAPPVAQQHAPGPPPVQPVQTVPAAPSKAPQEQAPQRLSQPRIQVPGEPSLTSSTSSPSDTNSRKDSIGSSSSLGSYTEPGNAGLGFHVTGPDRLVTLECNNRTLQLTYSPLKATPPTVSEIIDNARKSFSIPASTVVRVKDMQRNKIIETNSELIDAFTYQQVKLSLLLPPPMLMGGPRHSTDASAASAAATPAASDNNEVRFTMLAPIFRTSS